MSRLDWRGIKAAALADLGQLLPRLLPGGRAARGQWVAGDVKGAKGESLEVSMETGAWLDHASGERGGIIELVAAHHGVDSEEALRLLARELHMPAELPDRPEQRRNLAQDPRELCWPVPADAPDWQYRVRRPLKRGGETYTFAAAWEYRDAAGALLMIVARYSGNERGKTYCPWVCVRWDDGELDWVWSSRLAGEPAEGRPLYGLDRLAAHPDWPVLIVEGEKSADAAELQLPGWVAVSPPHGAQSPQLADWAPLAQRTCTIWPDWDQPGMAYAEQVARLVPGARVLDPRTLGVELDTGDDAADLVGRLRRGELARLMGPLAEQLRLTDRGEDGWLAEVPLQPTDAGLVKGPPSAWLVGPQAGEWQTVAIRIDGCLIGRQAVIAALALRPEWHGRDLIATPDGPAQRRRPYQSAAPHDQALAGYSARTLDPEHLQALQLAVSTAAGEAALRADEGAGASAGGGGGFAGLVRAFERWAAEHEIRPDALFGWQHRGRAWEPSVPVEDRFTFDQLLAGWENKREQIAICYRVTVARWREERRREILRDLLGKPATAEGRAELRRMIRAWTGGEDPLHAAVIEHFLWQTKRRAAGRGVDWDLMPVLVGPQGSGKTTVVDHLCACLQELSVPVTSQQITDQREAPLLATALAGRWDEMSGANKSDSDAIKRAVSQMQTACRRLFSQEYDVRTRRITFIGSSNLPLSAVLRDTSGARRFAELPVAQVDWDQWATIDLALVWRAVSEDDTAPILPHLAALRVHQRGLVHRDLLTSWHEHEAETGWDRMRILLPDSDSPLLLPPLCGWPAQDGRPASPGGWTTTQIAQRIAHYGRSFGRGSVQVEALEVRLRQLGWTLRRLRYGGRREYRWNIDPATAALIHAQAGDDGLDPACDLRAALAAAVLGERYEEAAQIRDQIRRLTNESPIVATTTPDIWVEESPDAL